MDNASRNLRPLGVADGVDAILDPAKLTETIAHLTADRLMISLRIGEHDDLVTLEKRDHMTEPPAHQYFGGVSPRAWKKDNDLLCLHGILLSEFKSPKTDKKLCHTIDKSSRRSQMGSGLDSCTLDE